jgi:magnesium transporter
MPNNLDLKNVLQEIDEAKIQELRAKLDEYYPQDLAEEYPKLDEDESKLLFDILSYKQGAAVFVELETNQINRVLQHLSDTQIIKFTNEMELDDAADIIALLDDERMLKVLEQIQRPYELKELLSYDPETCGGIMNPDFISVRADLKISAALRYVRLKAKRENDNQIIYIYVTKKFGELVGVISIKGLFLAPDNALVKDYMRTEVISVNVNDDQEKVAEITDKYHFLAIPVINENKQLVGVVTIDDIVDVIKEETTEDIYQSSGISVESDFSVTPSADFIARDYFNSYRARTPWLIITLFGQYCAAVLIAGFDSTIVKIPIAISFMPLLSGLSGNIGNQSTTIIVRGIATGEINTNKINKIFLNELLVSFGIGLTCACITGVLSFYFYHNCFLSLLISLSLIISMALAVSLGTITPLIFKKFDIDPATASGPLITTFIDMLSFFVYLSLIAKFTEVLV